jgi:hypothetical protein
MRAMMNLRAHSRACCGGDASRDDAEDVIAMRRPSSRGVVRIGVVVTPMRISLRFSHAARSA